MQRPPSCLVCCGRSGGRTDLQGLSLVLITKHYPNVTTIPIKVDVGKESEVKELVDAAVKSLGRLDVMVSAQVIGTNRSHKFDLPQFNNAGIMHPQDDNAINTEEKIWCVFGSRVELLGVENWLRKGI